MSRELFLRLLDTALTGAEVVFREPEGDRSVGRGGANFPRLVAEVHHPRMYRRALAAGNLGLGESYMAGDFDLVEGTLPDFLKALLWHRLDRSLRGSPALALRILALRVVDTLRGKAINVQRHYDLGDDLFRAFLDETMTYSCGYAKSPTDDPETLQRNKLDRIAAKLQLAPGERLLDIGCGFGGLLTHAAQHYGVTGVGVTLSRRHVALGNQRIAAAGLADRIELRYADYGDVKETFDKVVSVGMMEHVPRREYNRYFATIARCLAPHGRGLVHAVGANAVSNDHDPFIQKYIFPNSNQPRLSEIAAGLESHGLPILDVENLIRHYGYTAAGWLRRFQQNRGALDATRYDATFCRMWEYYLACCVAAADASDSALYQVLFTHDHRTAIPLARV